MPSPQVRRDVERLAAMERGSASAGEARAAEALAGMLAARGLRPRLEHERATGGFWWPALATSLTGLAAAVAPRRLRVPAVAAALAAALLEADDTDNGAQPLRRLLPSRTTTNVIAWAGDPDSNQTLLLVAHHDAARTGLLFHPGVVPFVDRVAHDWYERQTTSTQTGQLLALGPALAAAGTATGLRPLRAAGAVWCAGVAALVADVARSPVVPGANDNLSAVAVLLELAERLAAAPVEGIRVGLLSTGSEEAFMEGMRGFVARHRAALDPARTRVVALECVGSPHLALIEGEGMVRIRDYDESLKEEIAAAADRVGAPLWRGLRLGAGGTDALPALRAGYRAACLAACTDLKTPANYHWPSDVPEHLDWGTIGRAADVCEALVRGPGAG